MRNKKINLDNIKVVIFDFDDTLAIHKDKNYMKKRNKSEENLLNYYYKAYENPDLFYEEIEPCNVSIAIQNFINHLRSKKIKMYCVSGMQFSLHLKAKEYFVHKYYGDDIEVISSKNQKLKVEATKIIGMINKCKLNEILFIDDIKNNVIRFNDFEINSVLPEDVATLV